MCQRAQHGRKRCGSVQHNCSRRGILLLCICTIAVTRTAPKRTANCIRRSDQTACAAGAFQKRASCFKNASPVSKCEMCSSSRCSPLRCPASACAPVHWQLHQGQSAPQREKTWSSQCQVHHLTAVPGSQRWLGCSPKGWLVVSQETASGSISFITANRRVWVSCVHVKTVVVLS